MKIQYFSPYLVFFCAILVTLPKCYSQVLERNLTSSGSSTVFSYSITSNYGVSTSAQATSNLLVDTEAILLLKEDSVITNKAGQIGGNTSAVIETTPNGSNIDLSGIEANNEFILDEGTTFRASLETSELDGNYSKGEAFASAYHTLTLTVTNSNSSFINAVRSNFENEE